MVKLFHLALRDGSPTRGQGNVKQGNDIGIIDSLELTS